VTRPSATGSEPVPKTIGMLEVAAVAASAPAVLAGAAITPTPRWVRSAAQSRNRSSPPPAPRDSNATVPPPTAPAFPPNLCGMPPGFDARLRRTGCEKPDHRHRCLLRPRRDRPRSRAAECDQQFPSSDGDCHTPLPREVRRGNDTTPRAYSLAVQGG